MSKMVSGFAARLLQIKMFARFFTRLCLIVFCIQVVAIISYNVWFNPLWLETKTVLADGMGMAWDAAKHFKLGLAAQIFTTNFNGFYDLQTPVFVKSFWVWMLIPIFMIYVAVFDEKEDEGREFIQGRKYISPKELNYLAHEFMKFSLFKGWRLKQSIPLGRVYLPIKEEPKQTFIVGKPGSGKTNAFNQIMVKVRKRNQKGIAHDYKGDYVEKLYDAERGDILFNPLDSRSIGWCLFNDCKSVMDIEAFSYGLIPDAAPGTDPFWNNAARDVMVGILRYCHLNSKRTNQDIWQTSILSNKDLYNLLRVTPGGEAGAIHLTETDGRTAGSIRSNLTQFTKVFEYMSSMTGDFSITRWVEDKEATGTIFVTNYANLQNTLKPMISLFIQTVGRVLLSQSDDIDNRLFFFLDEFGQLPPLATIQNLMTASRSKGGSVFIGVQDIGQLDKLYKKESRTTILNSASNRLIFNCKDHDTAKFFSTDIGETEYYEYTATRSLSMGEGDRINTAKQRRKELLVTPEDIQSLPDLNAFVSIGHHNITLSKWKYRKLEKKDKAFIQRPELDLVNAQDVVPIEFEPVKLDHESKTTSESIQNASAGNEGTKQLSEAVKKILKAAPSKAEVKGNEVDSLKAWDGN